MRSLREDLQATLDVRRDLGPDYDGALVDSLVERLDATIAARVESELRLRGVAPPRQKGRASGMVPIALGSLGLGVPLTAIASSNAGALGLVVAWMSIVVVNLVAGVVLRR